MDGMKWQMNEAQRESVARWVKLYGPETVRRCASLVSAMFLAREKEGVEGANRQLVADELREMLEAGARESTATVMCLASMVESALQAAATVMAIQAQTLTGMSLAEIEELVGSVGALERIWRPWAALMLNEAAVVDGQG